MTNCITYFINFKSEFSTIYSKISKNQKKDVYMNVKKRFKTSSNLNCCFKFNSKQKKIMKNG